jgi:hypothetical protein
MAHTPFGLRSIFDLNANEFFSIADHQKIQFLLEMNVAVRPFAGTQIIYIVSI